MEISLSIKFKLAAFQLLDRGIPRQGQNILIDDKKVGVVTSGTFSHNLKCGIGLCHLGKQTPSYVSEFDIESRGKIIRAKISKLPFISNTSLRK